MTDFYGTTGNDTLTFTSGNDAWYADAGTDTLVVNWSGTSTRGYTSYGLYSNGAGLGYYGTFSNDNGSSIYFDHVEHIVFYGGSGNDEIGFGRLLTNADGGGGTDALGIDYYEAISGIHLDLTQAGAQLLAGPGSITHYELLGNVTASEHADTFVTTGSDLDDYLQALGGNDTLTTVNGNDTFYGGAGTDTLIIDWSGTSTGSYTSYGLYSNGTGLGYYGTFSNNDGRSVFFDRVEHFIFTGGSGNDEINFGLGLTDADGAGGVDGLAINYQWTTGPIVLDLTQAGAQLLTGPGSITNYEWMRYVVGSDESDTFVTPATDLNDQVLAADGDDTMTTVNGNDTFEGGAGNDLLIIDWSGTTMDSSTTYGMYSNGAGLGYYGTFTNVDGRSVYFNNVEHFDFTGGSGNDHIHFGTALADIDGAGGIDGLGISYALATGPISLDLTQTGAQLLFGPGSVTHMEYLANVAGSPNGDTFVTPSSDLDDYVDGAAGNDTLTTVNGNDTFYGGAGTDTLIIDWSGATGNSYLSYGIYSNGSGLGYYGTYSNSDGRSVNFDRVENIFFTGSDLDDTLVGLGASDSLYGHDGDDSLVGGDGDDTLVGGPGNDTLDGGNGTDTASYLGDPAGVTANLTTGVATDGWGGSDSLVAIENLEGSQFADSLTGNDDDNLIIGFGGNDTLNGAGGNDTLFADEGDDSASGGDGDDFVEGWTGNDTLLGDGGNDTLLGMDDNDSLDGGTGNDDLWGDSGSDTLIGGLGNDSLTGGTEDDWLYGGGGFDTIYGNSGNDALFGNGANDTLFGGLGNDTLDGGLNTDSMNGGSGDDVYYVDAVSDVVTEASGQGTDEVRTTMALTSLTNYANVEVLSFVGSGDATLSGSTGADRLNGGAGNDSLSGGADNDTLAGGAGNDVLLGNAGNDLLDGGTGADTMHGGGGDDTFFVDNAGDVVGELAGQGFDEIQTTLNTFSLGAIANVEVLTFVGTGNASLGGGGGADAIYGGAGNDTLQGFGDADQLSGGAGNDRLLGNSGNDTLDGGTGDDAMFGGDGDDTYFIDSADDRVGELTGQGTDEVMTSLSFTNLWSFANQVEVAAYIGTGDATIMGALADNHITGNTGNDSLRGFGGNDSVNGGGGNDTLTGDNGDDVLLGGSGNDLIFGGIGADTIQGGSGRDFMTGKGGPDVFLFADGDFSGAGTSNSDRIEDFVQGDDLIDLSLVDAIAGGADNAFAFIGTAAFHNVAGELRYEQTPTSTMVYGDTDGDGVADFAIKLAGLVALNAGDFVL